MTQHYHRPKEHEELRKAVDELEANILRWRNQYHLDILEDLARNPFYTESVMNNLADEFGLSRVTQKQLRLPFSPHSDGS